MPIVESKLRRGKLTLGGKEFATQASNIKMTPEHKSEGDALETLDGSTIAPVTKRSDTMKINAIQDFTEPKGFLAYCDENDLTEVTFEWQLTSSPFPKCTGKVQIRAVEVGGDINTRLSSSAEWPATDVKWQWGPAAQFHPSNTDSGTDS